MRITPQALAFVLATLLAPASHLVAQTPADGLSAEHRQYLAARRRAVDGESKAAAKRLADARKYYREHPVLDAYGRFETPGEVSLLEWTVSELAAEASRLQQIATLRTARPAGGPRTNARYWSEETGQLLGRVENYEQRRKAMRARMPDAARARREDDAYALLTQAVARHDQTMDVWLSAVGAPSMAEASAARLQNAVDGKKAMEAFREDRRRKVAEGDRAWSEFGGFLSAYVRNVLAEGRNVSTTDLGEGGDEARRTGVFSPAGLRHGALFQDIVAGRVDAVRGDARIGYLVAAYVVKFSAMCQSSLPPDKVEITTTEISTLVEKNGFGIETSRTTFTGRPESTGTFATPAFGQAYVSRAGANPLAELAAFASDPLAVMTMPIDLGADVRRLIARHGCSGTVTDAFSTNLLRLTR